VVRRTRDILIRVTDILIRDVPDDVVAALDANANRSGQTRAEYLRRLLADQQRPALTREQLNRFAERTADLGNPEVMAAAWR
jgi:Ribbon-helix-helix protein, copG family